MPTAARRYQFSLTARLRLWSGERPGLTRVRVGKGFRFTYHGRTVRDADTLARIRALAIPPAWEWVVVCPHANGHLQAVGYDARGRKQYRYHPAFRAKQDGAKFDKLAEFADALPGLRRRVKADLALPGLPKEKVLAAVVSLLDRTHLRVGNEEYARANKSFGLSTLLDRHVTFTAGKVALNFRGKSGVRHRRVVSDARLARIVRACRDLPGQHLFQYRSADGRVGRVGSADVNRYIAAVGDGPFTAKDFRTWAGTVRAAAELAQLAPPESKAAGERAVVGVVRTVADALGNTPAVCRKSYVHPQVLADFLAGKVGAVVRRAGLSADEGRAVAVVGRAKHRGRNR